jgi:hypothetical protein
MDARAELGIGKNTWNEWVIGGLPVTQPGTHAEMVLTDDLICWLRENRSFMKPLPPQKQKGRKK